MKKTKNDNVPVFADVPNENTAELIALERAKTKNEPAIDMTKKEGEFLPLPAFWS